MAVTNLTFAAIKFGQAPPPIILTKSKRAAVSPRQTVSKFILISLEYMPRMGCVRNKTEIASAGVSRPTSTVV